MKVSNLNVALLVHSPKTGRDISNQLRQLEILSDYHRNLDELWLSIERLNYDLLIVDSKMLNDGDLSLLDHPRVKNHSLPIIIYLNGTTPVKEVLEFQNNCYCIGLVRDDLPWELQIRPLLLNISQKRIQQVRLDVSEKKIKEYRERVGSMIEKLEVSKEFLDQHLLFYKIFDKAGDYLESMPFLSASLKALNEVLPIDKISSLIISPHSKQLFCPKIKAENYEELPFIHLDEEAKEGIDQNLSLRAREVVHQVFGTNHIELQICGQFSHPSLIFYLEVNQIDENAFPWKVLESLLTSLYRSELMKRFSFNEEKFSIWKFLDIAQSHSVFNSFSEYRVIEFDLSEISSFSLENHHIFSWERLRVDLENQMKGLLGKDLQFVEWAHNKVLMLVPREGVQKKFHQILEWNDHFPLWSYFTKDDLYIPSEVKIRVDYFKSLIDHDSKLLLEEEKGLTRKSFLEAPKAWRV